jgi:hypothetical protein
VCGQPAVLDAPQCAACGHLFRTQFAPPPDQTQAWGLPTTPAPGPASYPAPGPPSYPAYGAPPPPPQPVYIITPAQTDVCAVLSTVFSGMGLFVCCFGWIFSMVGVILGIVSLVRISGNPMLKGTGLAWTGIALGIAAPVLTIVWMLVSVLSAAATP